MQSICLEDRKKLSLVGVTKIISSTNTQAAVEIGDDTLVITGTDLKGDRAVLDARFRNEFRSIADNAFLTCFDR